MSFFLSREIRNEGVLSRYGCKLASDTSAPDVIPMTIERLGVVKVNITRMAWEMEMDSKSLMCGATFASQS